MCKATIMVPCRRRWYIWIAMFTLSAILHAVLYYLTGHNHVLTSIVVISDKKAIFNNTFVTKAMHRKETTRFTQEIAPRERNTWEANDEPQKLVGRRENGNSTDHPKNLNSDTSEEMKSENRTFKIALYGIRHGMLLKYLSAMNFRKCYYFKNCEITTEKQELYNYIEADAVLFQAGRVPSSLPKHKDENQVFVFTSIESPEYLAFTNLESSRFHSYFNWTMTYRIDSSIPYLYGSVVPKSFRITDMEPRPINSFLDMRINSTYVDDIYNRPVGTSEKNYTQVFNQKKKSAVWLVSHCYTASNREKYVENMQKYIDVDIVGRCNANSSLTCPKLKGRSCEDMFSKTYKFYLSFENSICNDYITEKAFKWFIRDIVIVVRGARNYNKHLPKGTYVDTDDFETPKDLALYMNRLASNEVEYTNLLKRKDSYTVIDMRTHSQLSYCHLCYKLNNLKQNREVIPDIHKWWNSGMCVKGKQT